MPVATAQVELALPNRIFSGSGISWKRTITMLSTRMLLTAGTIAVPTTRMKPGRRYAVMCPVSRSLFFFSSMFYIPFLLSLSLLFSIRWSSTAQFPLQSTGGESTTPNRFLLFAFATSIRSHLSAITNYYIFNIIEFQILPNNDLTEGVLYGRWQHAVCT